MRNTPESIARFAERMRQRGEQMICHGHGDYQPDEDCARAARLLAVMPAMLEALKHVEQVLDEGKPSATLSVVRLAIQLAEEGC